MMTNMQKPKKLIFIFEFNAMTGGMTQSSYSLIKALAYDKRFDITIVANGNSELYSEFAKLPIKCLDPGIGDFVISSKHVIKTLYTSYSIWKLIRCYINESIIVTNNVGSSILVTLMFNACKHECFISRGGDYRSGIVGRFMQWKFKYVKSFVAISNKQIERLVNVGVKSDKIVLIHNGLPLETAMDLKNKKYLGGRHSLRISTIGYISDNKNQIEGVRLIAFLLENGYNASLNIYGAVGSFSDQNYYELLLNEIHSLELDKYVNFKGFVDDKDQIFSETDVLISFSKSEGFGRSLVEAMLRKCPVIAFKGAGGPVDITDNGKHGFLVDRNNYKDYYNIIENITNGYVDIDNFVNDSFVFAYDNFSEIKMIKKYSDYLLNL